MSCSFSPSTPLATINKQMDAAYEMLAHPQANPAYKKTSLAAIPQKLAKTQKTLSATKKPMAALHIMLSAI